MADVKQKDQETPETEVEAPKDLDGLTEAEIAKVGEAGKQPINTPEPSGELVSPDDPRAADEINALMEKLGGGGPSAQEIAMAIAGGDTLPDVEAQKSQVGIVARILAASDVASVLDLGEPVKGEEMTEVPLEVRKVDWQKSTFEGGSGVYAVIDAVRLDQDEPVKITTGSVNVMTQLLKLQTMKAFPQKVKIVRSSRPTQSGYYPYWLQPA